MDSTYLPDYTNTPLGLNLQTPFSFFKFFLYVDVTVKFHGTDWTDRVTAPCKDKYYPRQHNQGSWCAFPLWSDESGFAYNRHKTQWGNWIGCQASEDWQTRVNTVKHSGYNTYYLLYSLKRFAYRSTHAFRMILTTNTDYFPKQHQPDDLSNGDAASAVRQEQSFLSIHLNFQVMRTPCHNATKQSRYMATYPECHFRRNCGKPETIS